MIFVRRIPKLKETQDKLSILSKYDVNNSILLISRDIGTNIQFHPASLLSMQSMNTLRARCRSIQYTVEQSCEPTCQQDGQQTFCFLKKCEIYNLGYSQIRVISNPSFPKFIFL